MVSLYRKWRSRTFDDLLGQEHVTRTLRNAVRSHREGHAYLFTGPRGTGKTSAARILAKAVNCLQPREGNPCDECEMCRAANDGRAVDVIEIDAASNTSVENVRELRERVAYAAGEGRHKVYIVDEVHRLSGAAFDAFLKTLEEPPPHVIFVFASTEPHKVPETITSRCQRFDFRRIPASVTLERLRQVARAEGTEVEEDALRLLALHAHGSLRDALGLLEQVSSYGEGEIRDQDVRSALGLADATVVARLTNSLVDGQLGAGLKAFHRFMDEGGDPAQLALQLVEYWRAVLLASAGTPTEDSAVDPVLLSSLADHAGRLHQGQLLAMIRAMADRDFSPRFHVPSQLPFEVAYVEAALALGPPLDAIAAPTSADTPDLARRPGSARSDSSPASVVAPEPARTDQVAAPAQRAGSGARHDDLETVWPAVVAGMRSRSPSLQAILRSGHLMKAEGNQITIGFLHDFHRDQFADAKKRKLLEEVVTEVVGASYRVNCVRTTREEIESLKGLQALQEDDGFVEEVAERFREFHARELGNGHS